MFKEPPIPAQLTPFPVARQVLAADGKDPEPAKCVTGNPGTLGAGVALQRIAILQEHYGAVHMYIYNNVDLCLYIYIYMCVCVYMRI